MLDSPDTAPRAGKVGAPTFLFLWTFVLLTALLSPYFLYGALATGIDRLDARVVEAADRLAPLMRGDGVSRELVASAAGLLVRDELGLNYLTLHGVDGDVLWSDGRFETVGASLSASRARQLRGWLYHLVSAERRLSLRRDGRLMGDMSYGLSLARAAAVSPPWFWVGVLLWLSALALSIAAVPQLRRIRGRPRSAPPEPAAERTRATDDEAPEWGRLVDTFGMGFLIVDVLQRVQFANELAGELLGHSGSLRGWAADEVAVFTDDWGNERLSPLQRCLAGERGPLRDTLNVAGRRVAMVAARIGNDRTCALFWPADDNERARERAAVASSFSGDAFWAHSEEAAALIDVEGVVRSVNPALCRLLQTEQGTLVDAPLVRILPDAGAALVSTDDVISGETAVGATPEESVRMAYRVAMIDAAGVPMYLMTLHIPREAGEAPPEEWDALTGLPMRARLMEEIDRVWPEDDFAAPYALLVVDIVDFGRRNRSLGRDACDKLLAAFARRLVASVPDAEIVARLGGDEFAVLLRLSVDVDNAEAAARRILEAFAEPVRGGGLELPMQVDIGLALSPDDSDSPAMLLQRAETALSVVQEAGDHAPRRYVPEMAAAASHAAGAARTLGRALAQGELALRLRPIWRGDRAAVAAAHVELSWDAPDGAHHVGAELFAHAEEQGLCGELAVWCLRKVVETYADWRNIGLTPVPLLFPVPNGAADTPMLAQAWRAAESRYRIPPFAVIALLRNGDGRIAAVGPRVAREAEVDGADILYLNPGTLKFDPGHARRLVAAGRERGIPVIAGPLNREDRSSILAETGIEYWHAAEDTTVSARAFGRLIAHRGADPL